VFWPLTGALFLAGNARTTIVGSQLDRTLVVHSGGAAYIKDNSSLTVLNSTVQANYAQFGGGFICTENSTLTIAHSVLRGNAALKKGGAIQAIEQCKVGGCIFRSQQVESTARKHILCTPSLSSEHARVCFVGKALRRQQMQRTRQQFNLTQHCRLRCTSDAL
jgi:hypothetical protein